VRSAWRTASGRSSPPRGREQSDRPINEPELQRIARELDDATGRARVLCAGLDDEQLGWSARPGAWSIAEILRHLEITTEVFLPGLDEAEARARRRGRLAPGPHQLNAWGRLLVWYLEPPPPIRLPAPRPLRPTLQGRPGRQRAAAA